MDHTFRCKKSYLLKLRKPELSTWKLMDLFKFKIGRHESPWAEDCNVWKIMIIDGEFTTLINDLKWENNLLKHILRCERCKSSIRKLVEKRGGPRTDRWSNLFLRDLPDRYKPFNNDVSFSYSCCPRIEEYHKDLERFIEDRVKWRMEVNERILLDAELELEDLRRTAFSDR